MKRSSEETDASSQPLKASRKRYSQDEEQAETGRSDNASLEEMKLERRLQVPTFSDHFGSGAARGGVTGMSADAVHQSSMLASHAHSQLGGLHAASVPSLLANLPFQQQQLLLRQQLHQQQQQQQQRLQFPPYNTQAQGADALTQYLLTAHLSRGMTPQITPQQLQWLGLSTNAANTTQQQQQQPTYMDRANYYANRSALGLVNPEGLMAYNLNPSVIGSHFPQEISSIGLSSTHGLEGATPQPSSSTAAATTPNTDTVRLSLSSDRSNLSEYQCLIREQVDLFAATQEEIDGSAQGRNRPIVVDQVGIQCRHCSSLPSSRRSRGAVYFPAKLNGLYQAAQVSPHDQPIMYISLGLPAISHPSSRPEHDFESFYHSVSKLA
jgi:hypothetical protein